MSAIIKQFYDTIIYFFNRLYNSITNYNKQSSHKQQQQLYKSINIKSYHNHIIILSHGLNGSITDLEYLATQLNNELLQHNNTNVYIHISDINSSLFGTYSGIDQGGQLLYNELIDIIKQYNHIQYISFIGHSLGGLYIRYVAYLLYINDIYKLYNIYPIVFMTLATPHMSSVEHNSIIQYFTPYVIGQTGKQLMLSDSNKLLYNMSNNEYIQSLKQFKILFNYANHNNDMSVHYHTSVIDWSINKQHYNNNNDYRQIVIVQHNRNNIDHKCYLTHIDNDKCSLATEICKNLSQLHWTTYIIYNTRTGFAHTDIVVRNEKLNSYGKYIVKHIVQQVVNAIKSNT